MVADGSPDHALGEEEREGGLQGREGWTTPPAIIVSRFNMCLQGGIKMAIYPLPYQGSSQGRSQKSSATTKSIHKNRVPAQRSIGQPPPPLLGLNPPPPPPGPSLPHLSGLHLDL